MIKVKGYEHKTCFSDRNETPVDRSLNTAVVFMFDGNKVCGFTISDSFWGIIVIPPRKRSLGWGI